jgi:hypothetical protein
MWVTMSVLATVTIDDTNLTVTVANAHSSVGPDGLTITDQSVISGAVSSYEQRVQAEINAIKATQARLDTLQSHETALQNMIAALQAYRPSVMPAST